MPGKGFFDAAVGVCLCLSTHSDGLVVVVYESIEMSFIPQCVA